MNDHEAVLSHLRDVLASQERTSSGTPSEALLADHEALRPYRAAATAELLGER